MPDEPHDSSGSMARRMFFRRLLVKGLDRAEEATNKIGERFTHFVEASPRGVAPPPSRRHLRPPGSVSLPLMRESCSRCGKCVEACPANCIILDANHAEGLPHIVPRDSPCVVCSDLSCMKACPTGTLQLVASPADIRMGVARVDFARCLRKADGSGEDCRLCITPCPMGESAIGLDAIGRVQVRPGCVGCGVCERACPTNPASIWIEPYDA